jgi:hypothetical protein
MNGVSKNRHGVYYVRKKVPKQLAAPPRPARPVFEGNLPRAAVVR